MGFRKVWSTCLLLKYFRKHIWWFVWTFSGTADDHREHESYCNIALSCGVTEALNKSLLEILPKDTFDTILDLPYETGWRDLPNQIERRRICGLDSVRILLSTSACPPLCSLLSKCPFALCPLVSMRHITSTFVSWIWKVIAVYQRSESKEETASRKSAFLWPSSRLISFSACPLLIPLSLPPSTQTAPRGRTFWWFCCRWRERSCSSAWPGCLSGSCWSPSTIDGSSPNSRKSAHVRSGTRSV